MEQGQEQGRWTQEMKQALWGEGKFGMQGSWKYEKAMRVAVAEGSWSSLDLFSDGGADAAGTPLALFIISSMACTLKANAAASPQNVIKFPRFMGNDWHHTFCLD